MKICVVTGTRAEYGLLRWILQYIKDDIDLELKLIVTGMHLSPEFGLTYTSIEEDGFFIDKKVEILLSSDTPVGISKAMGLGIISFAEAFFEIKPDLLLLLGDRFEAFAAASAAMIGNIPIAHVHGGESTEGLIDESIRHSITKMSHLHFTSTMIYKKKVEQLGEHPSRVFNVGAPGLDNIKKLHLKTKKIIYKILGLNLNDKFFLITYHPLTLDINNSEEKFDYLLEALSEFKEYKLIFTMPNADTNGRIIMEKIKSFLLNDPSSGNWFYSLGQLNYLSALRHASLVIGNSSSGIIEAPSFKVPSINIGNRQKGRLKPLSVIDCSLSKKEICLAIKKGMSKKFRHTILNLNNPYGEGNSSKAIVKIIKRFDLTEVLNKKFYNL